MVAKENKRQNIMKEYEMSIRIEIMEINPQMAAEFLKKNFDRNRRVTPGRVDYYAKQMLSGQWTLTHQGIAFDRDGNLVDGQTRLMAIVKSGVAVKMPVAFNVDRENVKDFDSGQSRSMSQRLRIAGVDIDTNIMAVANRMRRGISRANHVFTHAELQNFLNDYIEGIDAAIAEVPNLPGIKSAAVRAVVARAFYHVSSEVVADFCQALKTGESKTGRSIKPTFLLAQWAASNAAGNISGKNAANEKLYRLAESALLQFAKGKAPRQLRSTEHELFPLPFDDEEIARLHHAAVLSKPIADEIRKLVEDGVSQKEVAKRLKVSGYTINAIVAGRTWKD